MLCLYSLHKLIPTKIFDIPESLNIAWHCVQFALVDMLQNMYKVQMYMPGFISKQLDLHNSVIQYNEMILLSINLDI